MANAAKIHPLPADQLPADASEEIERVARAIVLAHGEDPDQMLQFDPFQLIDPPTMLRQPRERWKFAVALAITHIAAFNAILVGRSRR